MPNLSPEERVVMQRRRRERRRLKRQRRRARESAPIIGEYAGDIRFATQRIPLTYQYTNQGFGYGGGGVLPSPGQHWFEGSKFEMEIKPPPRSCTQPLVGPAVKTSEDEYMDRIRREFANTLSEQIYRPSVIYTRGNPGR